VHFHLSIGELSARMALEKEKTASSVFVTPTSYLALITSFKSLLKAKREEILGMKTRYEMGLSKLEFASSQVSQNGKFAPNWRILSLNDLGDFAGDRDAK